MAVIFHTGVEENSGSACLPSGTADNLWGKASCLRGVRVCHSNDTNGPSGNRVERHPQILTNELRIGDSGKAEFQVGGGAR
jgi:hypothetical protein